MTESATPSVFFFTQPDRSALNTREAIIEAGHQAINAKSYHSCGLNEILSIAGVPKGSFYHHFKSKEDFGLQMIEVLVDELNQYLRERFTDRSLSPVNRLKQFFKDRRSFYLRHDLVCECVMSKMALEVSQLSEAMRAAIRYGQDCQIAALNQVITEAQAEKEIAYQGSAEAMAKLIVDAAVGYNIRIQVERSIQPLDDFTDLLFNHLLGA